MRAEAAERDLGLPEVETRAEVLRGLVLTGALAFGLGALFWFALGSLPYEVRAASALACALGPLAILWIGDWSSEATGVVIRAVAILAGVVAVGVGLVAAALRFRRSIAVRMLALTYVVLWTTSGCVLAALRMSLG